MTTKIDNLSILGLSEIEQQIFTLLLEGKDLSASEIAKQIQLNRSAIYPYLEKMIEKRLVVENTQSAVKTFSLVTKKELEKIIKEKISSLKNLQKQIPQLLKNKPAPKSEFTVYGEKDRDYLAEMVANASGDILYLGGLSGVEHIYDEEWYYKYYAKKRRKNLNVDYMISDWTKSTVSYYFKESDMFTKRRFLPGDLKANGCIVIFKNKVLIFRYKPNFQGVLIEEPTLVKILKMSYFSLWKDLEGKNIPPKM